jgi:hypothetical protein
MASKTRTIPLTTCSNPACGRTHIEVMGANNGLETCFFCGSDLGPKKSAGGESGNEDGDEKNFKEITRDKIQELNESGA